MMHSVTNYTQFTRGVFLLSILNWQLMSKNVNTTLCLLSNTLCNNTSRWQTLHLNCQVIVKFICVAPPEDEQVIL
jgi:hypothetical protein